MSPLVSSMLLLFVAALAAAPPSTPANDRPPESLAGDWQTVIASPQRPWIFVVHFEPGGTAWTGTMSIEGLADFPLHDVRVEPTRIRFRFPPEFDSVEFEGGFGSEGILGHVSLAGQVTPTRLTRMLPLPTPANRLQAWQQDIDVASARLSEYDRSFTPRGREEFRQALALLKQSLPRMNDAEILVALSRAVALAENAHTRLRLDPTLQGAFSTEFPLRIWRFSDGFYVIRAASEYRKALRCRVIAINDHDLSTASDEVASLFAGNDSWAAYLAPIYLTSPDVLHGLGLIPDMKGTSFTFQDARGTRFDLWVRSEPILQSTRPSESWQELSPLIATGTPSWLTALDARPERLPLYLRHPDQPYWFEFLPKKELLYFQFNHSDNAEEGSTFREFGDSLLAFMERHPVHNLIVDLRLNSGGNLEVAKTFVRDLAQNESGQRRLFVILGHCTFSAGLYHAAQLKQFSRAIFVGDSAGDRLDYWAEGGRIVLPNSHAVISYSNGFHRYSTVDYPEHQPYYEELSISSLAPDLRTPISSIDYFSGRDPALEAIEAFIRP